jgi:anaerobic magnesium-protoporphyrin IX monomethyl ester cyclase
MKKLKIALIAPPYPLEEAPSPPLGLCYVAAACEAAGAEVKIFDYIVSKYTPEKLRAALDAFRPDVVGATSVTMNFPQAIGIIQDARAHMPQAITMMGGPHVSFDVENTLRRYPQLDLIVIGEAEQTLHDLIPALQSPAAWPAIEGIAFRQDDQVLRTPARPLIADLDALPLPARHLLPMSRYEALGFPVSIITSRGCPNQCIFCLGRRMVGHKPRFRDPVRVVDEIQGLLAEGMTIINVADDLFTANRKRVHALCAEIRRRNLDFIWSVFARVNTVDPELLQDMRSAGCYSISFGIESGNPEILKRVKKGITLAQALQAVAWSKAAGLRTHASFMVGLPGETPATLEETRRFAESLGIEYGFHFLSPFPGTTVRENIEQYDLEILTDEWRLYDANQAIVRTAGLTPEQMDAFVADAYRKQIEERDTVEARYLQGTCSDEEFFTFEGFYRMKLAYAILSEYIISESKTLPADTTDPTAPLAAHVTRTTGMDPKLVARTIKNYYERGFLKYQQAPEGLHWFWTHNRHCPTLSAPALP